MGGKGLGKRGVRALAAPLLMAGVISGIGPGPVSAATCVNWTGAQPPSPGSTNELRGVAVVSSCRAWAVGFYQSATGFQTLIEQWKRSSWAQQSSPSPGDPNASQALVGAAATSASNAWAVGFTSTARRTRR